MIAEANKARETASTEIAPELTQTADMYAAGGSYGAGQRDILRRNLKASSAQEQAANVSSGMSSGSAASATRSRYGKSLASGEMQIEDTRTDKLSTALQAVAAAKEARTGRMVGAYTTTAQLVQGYKEPTMSDFASAEELQAASDLAEKERLGMQLTSQEKITAMGITADMQKTLLQVTSAEKIQAAADAAAKDRLGMQLTSEEQRAKDEIAAAANRLGLQLASAEKQTQISAGAQSTSAALNYALGMQQIKADKSLSEQSQAFTAAQNAKYKLTTDQQIANQNQGLYI